MSFFNTLLKPIVAAGALIWLIGCSTPMIMLNHHPETLVKLSVDTTFAKVDFNARTIVLEMREDSVTQPIGAYLDEEYSSINSVEQSYVLPDPAHVLFEKLADQLKASNAVVYRSYLPGGQMVGPSVPDAVAVGFGVKDMEYHRWDSRIKGVGAFNISRANVSLSISKGATPVMNDTMTVSVKVKDTVDPFNAMAQKLVPVIYSKLPGGN
jgi:hypothetical protein